MLFSVHLRKDSNDINKPNSYRNDLLDADNKKAAIDFLKRDYPDWNIDKIRKVCD